MNPSHWLVAAAGGGVWQTIDAGATWAPVTDDQPSLSINGVTFDGMNPSVVYTGMGTPHSVFATPGSVQGQAGVLKSLDGGTTWPILLGTTEFSLGDEFREIVSNGQTIVLALWSFFGDSQTGVWFSSDGGMSWTQTLMGTPTASARAMDLVVDPRNMNNQYTALGGGFANALDGVYRYDGASWTLVAGPWGALTGNNVKFALAPSNADIIYVSVAGAGIWMTSAAWSPVPSWQKLPDPPNSEGFLGAMAADPTNPAVLWAGGLFFYKFDGTTWTTLPFTHVDQRSVAWAGSRLILGNDGGVFSSTDGGNTWLDQNTNLSVTQFFAGSLHPTNPNAALGGCEDDGSEKWSGTPSWRVETGGDGMGSAFSVANPDTSWATSTQFLTIFRTTDGGVSYQGVDGGITDPPCGAAPCRPFFAKLERCPAGDVLVAGTQRLWKTTQLFSAGSPAWSINSPTMDADVTAIAFSPSDPNCMTYAYGTGSGQVRLTTVGGGLISGAWIDLDPSRTLPGRGVTALAIDPMDVNIMYVVLAGFDEDPPGRPGHVFKTVNALSATPLWFDVSPPNSNVPHHTVALNPADPSIVYAGTDLGAWRSGDAGSTWTHVSPTSGLPNAAVWDIRANLDTNVIVAFTGGRGAFEVVASSPPTTNTTTSTAHPPTTTSTSTTTTTRPPPTTTTSTSTSTTTAPPTTTSSSTTTTTSPPQGCADFPCGDDEGSICHIPPGNPRNSQTLCIGLDAVPAHLNHGDHCGPCR